MSSDNKKFTDPRWAAQVTDEMMDAIKTKAIDGKITCPVLRKFDHPGVHRPGPPGRRAARHHQREVPGAQLAGAVQQ